MVPQLVDNCTNACRTAHVLSLDASEFCGQIQKSSQIVWKVAQQHLETCSMCVSNLCGKLSKNITCDVYVSASRCSHNMWKVQKNTWKHARCKFKTCAHTRGNMCVSSLKMLPQSVENCPHALETCVCVFKSLKCSQHVEKCPNTCGDICA